MHPDICLMWACMCVFKRHSCIFVACDSASQPFKSEGVFLLNIFIPFCRCVCPSLKKSVCRCGCTCTSAFVSVSVCSARLCSAAALTWDSGSLCREQKADVMQQESPSQQSQVPTAAREIILKRCICACACMHVYRVRLSESVCVPLCICSSQDTPSASSTSGAQCRDSPLLMQREELLSAVS